jgi:hypothetical protein
MKLKMLFLSIGFIFLANVASAFTVKYYNKDSKKHVMEVKTNGSTTKIEFNSSTSGATSVQTSASVIEVKTACGWVKVKDGDKIVIKDGCITIE